MSVERQEELAALRALDALESAELDAFERELERDVGLRTLAGDLRETASAVALSARQVEPPAALRRRILEAVDSHSSAPGPTSTVVPFPLKRLLPWAVAAGFALLAGWSGLQIRAIRAENETLRTQRDLAEVAYQLAQSQLAERSLLAERMIADLGRQLQRTEDLSRLKITALASLLGNTPEARAIAVWDPDKQAGLLTVEKLPVIAAEQDYQIWVIDPQYPIPVDGGVFKPDPAGRATLTFKGDKPVSSVAAFAISLEKAGGVPKAEGPLVLLGRF
jgi:anti-sigma-K factor RskA